VVAGVLASVVHAQRRRRRLAHGSHVRNFERRVQLVIVALSAVLGSPKGDLLIGGLEEAIGPPWWSVAE
jgi:hypothetical protein